MEKIFTKRVNRGKSLFFQNKSGKKVFGERFTKLQIPSEQLGF